MEQIIICQNVRNKIQIIRKVKYGTNICQNVKKLNTYLPKQENWNTFNCQNVKNGIKIHRHVKNGIKIYRHLKNLPKLENGNSY